MLRSALLVAVGGLVVLHIGVLAYHLARTLAFPYDLNYGEGYVLFDAVRLSRGEPLYVDLQQFPMVRSPYPPLFPWMWVVLAALVGLNAWRLSRGIWPGVIAVGLLVGSPFVYQWAGYARVDLLALLLAVGGVLSAQ